jgi:hypothetical protein
MDIQFSQYHLLKRLSFLQQMFLGIFVENWMSIAHAVISGSSIPLVYMSVFLPVHFSTMGLYCILKSGIAQHTSDLTVFLMSAFISLNFLLSTSFGMY